jgi:Spx/MgsR family transcriptional regulator
VITVYGIRQCDTCRKALKWLDAQGLEHHFHDLRADGLDAPLVDGWLASSFGEQIVNRRSTTWRGLSEAERSRTGEELVALLLEHPTLVKRPVFMVGSSVVAIGFKEAQLAETLAG